MWYLQYVEYIQQITEDSTLYVILQYYHAYYVDALINIYIRALSLNTTILCS